MDYALVYDRLVPAAEYSGVPGSPVFKWTDVRTQPTEQEVIDEWAVRQAELAIVANNATAYQKYIVTLSQGFTHTDGYTYYCDERATTDMTKVLTLYDIDPSEPVTVFTLDGTIRDLTYLEFETLAKAIGNYQYTLRKQFWSELQR